MFGSSIDGFGFKNSDVDISVRYDSSVQPSEVCLKKERARIAKMLTLHGECCGWKNNILYSNQCPLAVFRSVIFCQKVYQNFVTYGR